MRAAGGAWGCRALSRVPSTDCSVWVHGESARVSVSVVGNGKMYASAWRFIGHIHAVISSPKLSPQHHLKGPSPRPHLHISMSSSPSPQPHLLILISTSSSAHPHLHVPISTSPSPHLHLHVPISTSLSPCHHLHTSIPSLCDAPTLPALLSSPQSFSLTSINLRSRHIQLEAAITFGF